MATYAVNPAAVAHASRLIDGRQYVLDSDWGEVQPERRRRTPTSSGTRGTTTPPGTSASPRAPTTRPRPATPSSTATSGASTGPRLIACVYRASEWRHKDVELAAHDLLQRLDQMAGID